MNNTLINRLKQRIPYDEDIFGNMDKYNASMDELLEDAINICLSIRYPFEEDYTEIPLQPKYENWVLRACVELYNLADKSGITNYSENGISWSKLSDGLSVELTNLITPKIGVPKGSDN